MKTRVTFRQFLALTSVAATLATGIPRGFAADDPAPPPTPRHPAPPANVPAQPSQPGAPEYDLVIVNGELLSGGFFNSHNGSKRPAVPSTLDNVVDRLREHHTEANIVLTPGLGNVAIPDLKLRAQNLPDELEALRVASGNQFDWTGPGGPSIDPVTGLPNREFSHLYALRALAKNRQNNRLVEAFNLGPYLARVVLKDDKSAEDKEIQKLREIIMTTTDALKADIDVNESSFQFHPGAKLLVIVGPKEMVDVAGKVIRALTGEYVGANESRAMMPSARAALFSNRRMIDQAEIQVEAERKAMDEMEKALKAGNNEKMKAILERQMEHLKKQLEQLQNEKAITGENP